MLIGFFNVFKIYSYVFLWRKDFFLNKMNMLLNFY